jgi:hypothetical protein
MIGLPCSNITIFRKMALPCYMNENITTTKSLYPPCYNIFHVWRSSSYVTTKWEELFFYSIGVVDVMYRRITEQHSQIFLGVGEPVDREDIGAELTEVA